MKDIQVLIHKILGTLSQEWEEEPWNYKYWDKMMPFNFRLYNLYLKMNILYILLRTLKVNHLLFSRSLIFFC